MEVDAKPAKKQSKKEAKEEDLGEEDEDELDDSIDIDQDDDEAVKHLAESSSDIEMHDAEGSDIDSDDAGIIKVKADAGKAPHKKPAKKPISAKKQKKMGGR